MRVVVLKLALMKPMLDDNRRIFDEKVCGPGRAACVWPRMCVRGSDCVMWKCERVREPAGEKEWIHNVRFCDF